jgi:hypothetical protein
MRRSAETTQAERRNMQHRSTRSSEDTTAGFVIDEQRTQSSFLEKYILRSCDVKQGGVIAVKSMRLAQVCRSASSRPLRFKVVAESRDLFGMPSLPKIFHLPLSRVELQLLKDDMVRNPLMIAAYR